MRQHNTNSTMSDSRKTKTELQGGKRQMKHVIAEMKKGEDG